MTSYPLQLISWNVAYRVRKQPQQLQAVLRHKPHLLALQETTATTTPLWREGLTAAGYHVISSFDLAEDTSILTGGRKYGVMIASPWTLEPLPPADFNIPWPERVLSVIVHSPWGAIECHSAHLPAGVSHGIIKIETFEGIADRLAAPGDQWRILCGDFNSPQIEQPDGTVITFGEVEWQGEQIIRNIPDDRWAQGEHRVITGLAQHDLPDVYRRVNGFTVQEQSWVRQIWGKPRGGRFDHVFASPHLNPKQCRYLHEYRDQGLSDHAPIEACFAPNEPEL